MEQPISGELAEPGVLPCKIMELERMDINEFLGCSEMQYNTQGSAAFFKEQYGGFNDNVYPILELYSSGIRYKEFRSHIKKLKKKGKLLQDKTTPECVLKFKKLNINE